MRAADGGLYSFQVWLGQSNEDITFAYLQRPPESDSAIARLRKTAA